MREANLTLIQTFYIVARDGSYSAAARKLGMSYQSAANHVRRLEQLLSERLVVSDPTAKYFGVSIAERTLVPVSEHPFIGHVSLDSWLAGNQSRAA